MTIEHIALAIFSLFGVGALAALVYFGWEFRGLSDEKKNLQNNADARKDADILLNKIRETPRDTRTNGNDFLRP